MPLVKAIPSPVEDCSRTVLEWDRFLDLLAGYSVSSIGRAWILSLNPSTDRDWIEQQHSLVDEMRLLLEEGVQPGLGSLFDPTNLLNKARIEGAALEAEEIRDILNLAGDVSSWTALMRVPPERVREQVPGLKVLSAPLLSTDLRPLVESLRTKIQPDGTLADDASPELRRIRREMERQQRAIEDSLRSALRRLSSEGSTQDDLITIRGERFVIPVKSELKRRVHGVIHGASSSGQTVYLEPLETIELNNELVRLLEDEQAEIHRIFLEMTRQIAVYAGIISEGAAVLAEVETLLVRARFAKDLDCVRPHFAQDNAAELELKKARHPLLEKRLRHTSFQDAGRAVSGIVPISFGLSDAERQLIISGPNTGGKTVSLKTAGLLSVMAQAGVPVPAEEALFPVFNEILANIGDSQSIEQDLSTFSAHIVHLNHIAQLAGPRSLVLLDELGSATDPEEGAALAVAISEHFLRSGAWTIISTHLTSLKVYAASHAGVRNAAVGFDEKTLAPTYELRLGIPGASAGINIAQRLGLQPEIVSAARTQLNTQTQDIATFLDRLHHQLEELETERKRVRQLEQELARERNRLAAEGMKEWRAKVRDLEQKLQSLLKDFEFRAKETVRAIDDRAAQQKLSKQAEQRIAKLRREFQESFNAAVVADKTGADKGDRNAQPHVVRHVTAGDTVKLRTLGRMGVVQREIDANTYEIAVGPMKMRVARDDIAEVIPARQNPVEAARRRGVSVSVADTSDDLRPEINLIGRTVDEATDEVEKFLDRAYLAGLPRVRIVHGTGMGILRRALRTMLERHPHVASISEPTQAEGGAGATVVELRD